MKTRPVPLPLVVCAIVLCAQGCYNVLATREELLLDSAKEKIEHGDFAGAISVYNQAIEGEPGNGGLYHHRGLARESLGDLNGAMRDFDRAVKLLPWDPAVLRSRVTARLIILDSLESSAADTPAGEGVFRRMHIVTTRIFLTDDLTRLITIEPEDSWARGERGRRRFELGDAQGAIEDFDEILALDSEAGWAYYDRGLAEATLGDYSGAIRDFTSVLILDGTDGWAYYQRGLARIHAGDHDEGCSDLRQAMDLGVAESESAMEGLCR